MTTFEAIVLGIVQGVTEFLPISSTGHLVLARNLFGMTAEHALAFDAILHLATATAVMLYFHRDIWLLVQTLLRKLGRLPVDRKNQTLLYALLIGTLPAVFAGLLLEDLMESTFRNPLLIAVVLILGSVLFMYAEYVYREQHRSNDIDAGKGFRIGLFQTLALIPGMSRSGSTIAGGMILGLSRSEAARFAFLLAIPVILGGGLLKLLELITTDVAVEWFPIGVGAVTSFLVGLAAIHFMLGFVRKHTLWPFIWYRLILAFFVIFIVFFG